MSDKQHWLRLVRRWLRSSRYEIDSWNHETGEYTRYYITRDGRLARMTLEYLDPEAFAREHVTADVISLASHSHVHRLHPSQPESA
jgi:hypothetical protein